MIQPGPCESTISVAHIMSCHVKPCYDLASPVQRLQFWDTLGRGQGPMSLGRVWMPSRLKMGSLMIIGSKWGQWMNRGFRIPARCSQDSEKFKYILKWIHMLYDAVPCVRKLQACSLWYVLVDMINDRKRASWATNGAMSWLAGWDDHSDFVAGLEPLIEHHRWHILVAYPWHPMTMGTLFDRWKSWQF